MDDTPRNASPFQKPDPPKALEYKSPETEEPVDMTISRTTKILFVAMLLIIFGLGIVLPVVALLVLAR